MTKVEKRQAKMKKRHDLRSQLIAQLDGKKLFICNPTRKTISHGVEKKVCYRYRLNNA